MSFRGKVKAILEDKKKGSVVTMAHPESQKKGTQGSEGGIKVPHSEVEAYRAKGWVPVEKSKVNESERLRRRDQSHGVGPGSKEQAYQDWWDSLTPAQKARFKREAAAKKVKKKVNEAKKVTAAQAHRIAKARAEAGVDSEVLASRHPDYVSTPEQRKKWAETVDQSTAAIIKHVPKKKVKKKAKKVKKATPPTTTNEDSDHPFYQKVKELSRGKKNKSLLEKKSKSVKTFKILLGTVDKKSKTDESLAGGAAQEVGAMGVRALAAWLKKRKSNDEKSNDEKSKMVAEGKREDAEKKRREIAKKTEARREQRAAEEKRAREAQKQQADLVKKGRRSDEQPDSPAHDTTHGDAKERRKTPTTDQSPGGHYDRLNNLSRKLGLGKLF
tara:strand:+ start:186 stop:1340 length:1155 start_codon:yes stop_codon:yes gene_type:complete